MRIGILGGTFNPIHKGHINLARQLYRILKLNKVIFVPSYIPPHKRLTGRTTSKDRLEMVKLAIKKIRHFDVSSFEIDKKGRSYSIDTLRFLKKRFGAKSKLFFLTGADVLAGLKEWRNLRGIFKLAEFIIVTRPGFVFKAVSPSVKFISIRPFDAASTQIRKYVRKGKRIDKLVPAEVARYIKKKGLYRP